MLLPFVCDHVDSCMEFILQEVGENEFSLVHERLINAQQLKKTSKANIGEFCVWDLQWGLLRSLNQAAQWLRSATWRRSRPISFPGFLHACFPSFAWWLLQFSGENFKAV